MSIQTQSTLAHGNSSNQESAQPTTGSTGLTDSAPQPTISTPLSSVSLTHGSGSGPAKLTVTVLLPDSYKPVTVNQTVKAALIASEYLALFASKQESYGVGNIDGFGEIGVLVRTNDKYQRLRNLLGVQDDGSIGKPSTNDLESVRDTWLDLMGYALIGTLVHDKNWRGPTISYEPLSGTAVFARSVVASEQAQEPQLKVPGIPAHLKSVYTAWGHTPKEYADQRGND